MARLRKKFPSVKVIVVYGNHDRQRAFYLGEVLVEAARLLPGVSIDNHPKIRKYFQWGATGLGYTHGDRIKSKDLAHLCQYEAREIWGATKRFEMHLGHLHQDIVKTLGGVIIRSVSMRLASWDKLDEMRGEQSRGKFIATNLNLNEWIKQLEAELESSCSAEHLRQEREARQKAEAKVQELDSLLTYSLQHSEKFREWAEAEVEELQSEIKMLTKKLSSTEDELADACEWLNERYKATSEADERAEKAEAELADEIKENCEQARLLAMSASRESATIGKTQRLEAQNEKLRGLLERAVVVMFD